MNSLVPRRAGFICHACQQSLSTKRSPRLFLPFSSIVSAQVSAPRSRRQLSQNSRLPNASIAGVVDKAKKTDESSAQSKTKQDVQPEYTIKTFDPAVALQDFRQSVANLKTLDIAAPEDATLNLLLIFYDYANCIVHGISKTPEQSTKRSRQDMTDAVLGDLAEGKPEQNPVFVPNQQMSVPFRESAAETIAELVYDLVRDHKVFISEKILESYVRIQCLLGRPEYLPEIFDLYANKKIPRPNTKPVTYTDPWPKMPKYAVPVEIAEASLEAAILKKNLSLAIAIIDTTVGAPAFRANKLLRKASGPFAFLAGTPLVAYAGADWVAHWQNTMDVELSKYTAIAGAMAYVGTLTTIGFVAITTSNDQMQRVVWRPGTRLGSRWVREEERAFFDRLALAWGFQEKSRWGEEYGPDWQTLRDECGMREMILDKTELMEGMQ